MASGVVTWRGQVRRIWLDLKGSTAGEPDGEEGDFLAEEIQDEKGRYPLVMTNIAQWPINNIKIDLASYKMCGSFHGKL